MTQEIERLLQNYEEQYAMSDEGGSEYPIAIAILHLAKSTDSVAYALRLLGTADANTPQGGLEIVAGALREIAQARRER